jgi:hypothetical protein
MSEASTYAAQAYDKTDEDQAPAGTRKIRPESPSVMLPCIK